MRDTISYFMYFNFNYSAEPEVNEFGKDAILSEILSESHTHIKVMGKKNLQYDSFY